MGTRANLWACADCDTEVEARDLEQAQESHDLFVPTHPYQRPNLSGEEFDAYPELFRVVTDGCGRLLAVTEDREVLATERLALGDEVDEAQAHIDALRRLVDRITPNLVDPID